MADSSRGDSASALPEFELEKYRLDRAHELELNRFTHTFEVERLKLLIILNGGAAAAWLTFSKADSTSQQALPALVTLLFAVLPWLFGLWCASHATEHALGTQRSFTQAYHRRRRAAEWRSMLQYLSRERVASILPSSEEQKTGESNVEAFERTADAAGKAGKISHQLVAK